MMVRDSGLLFWGHPVVGLPLSHIMRPRLTASVRRPNEGGGRAGSAPSKSATEETDRMPLWRTSSKP